MRILRPVEGEMEAEQQAEIDEARSHRWELRTQ